MKALENRPDADSHRLNPSFFLSVMLATAFLMGCIASGRPYYERFLPKYSTP